MFAYTKSFYQTGYPKKDSNIRLIELLAFNSKRKENACITQAMIIGTQ